MNAEHAQTLNRLFEDGYLIIMGKDSPVCIINTPEEQGEDSEGFHTYSTEDGYTGRLEELDLSEVEVYSRMDWLGLLNIDNYPHPIVDSDTITPCLQSWNQDLDNAYDEAGD